MGVAAFSRHGVIWDRHWMITISVAHSSTTFKVLKGLKCTYNVYKIYNVPFFLTQSSTPAGLLGMAVHKRSKTAACETIVPKQTTHKTQSCGQVLEITQDQRCMWWATPAFQATTNTGCFWSTFATASLAAWLWDPTGTDYWWNQQFIWTSHSQPSYVAPFPHKTPCKIIAIKSSSQPQIWQRGLQVATLLFHCYSVYPGCLSTSSWTTHHQGARSNGWSDGIDLDGLSITGELASWRDWRFKTPEHGLKHAGLLL